MAIAAARRGDEGLATRQNAEGKRPDVLELQGRRSGGRLNGGRTPSGSPSPFQSARASGKGSFGYAESIPYPPPLACAEMRLRQTAPRRGSGDLLAENARQSSPDFQSRAICGGMWRRGDNSTAPPAILEQRASPFDEQFVARQDTRLLAGTPQTGWMRAPRGDDGVIPDVLTSRPDASTFVLCGRH